MQEEIKKLIEKAIKEKYHDFNGRHNYGTEILVEAPKEKTHGDYSTNIALPLSKKLGKPPVEVAKEIITALGNQAMFEKVEVAGPGFINFYLKPDIYNKNVEVILKQKQGYGKTPTSLFGAKKIIVEYTDPNILKEFHIGHLMSNSIGEAISRLIEFGGAKVKRATWQSDVGLGIAKAVWGKMNWPKLSWPEAYVLGTSMYDKNGPEKRAMIDLNKKIFERSDITVNRIYDEGKKWSLQYFDGIYKQLGTKFDYLIFESQSLPFVKKIIADGVKKGVFETGEKGAIIFKGEKVGLHTRVFVTSEGLPTYEAKELALAQMKHSKYAYDQSVVITGNEINEYFKVLMAVMKQLFPELQKKTRHVGHGMMRLPEGKMGSRTGNVITFEFLLAEVEKLVAEKLKDRDLQDKEKQEIMAQVAMGALKYSILKQAIGSDIVYDFEKSISFEGDSGPYLQYSYARANSVLKKAVVERIKPSLTKIPSETTSLVKMMYHFPEIVQKAGMDLEPHMIVGYLTELAREFNNYYAKNKIVDKQDEFSPYKVAIAQAFVYIMENGLWLLAIPAPKKM